MNKIITSMMVVLTCLSLTACGSHKQSKKAISQSREESSLIKANSKLKKSIKKTSKKSSVDSKQQAVNQSTTQQSNTNRQVQGNTPAGNSSDDGQDQRPADVPANFKEYVSYTTDGHRMTQWNDAGSYCGDPDVQYQTIKAQTDAGF